MIHPTAIVDNGARIGEGVHIGAYAIVGPHVSIGDRTSIASHAILEGHTEIGQDCRIYAHASIGTPAQSKKTPTRSYVKIGDKNIIREYVTINAAMHDEATTVVGSRNFLMIGVHVAHDAQVGNDVTIANNTAMAGHVIVEDFAVIGGMVGLHQFVRVGRNAMVGGLTKVVMDVPPYSLCDGNPAALYGINAVGLRRAGFTPEQRATIRRVIKELFGSGRKLSSVIAEIKTQYSQDPCVKNILDFIQASKRGMTRILVDNYSDVDLTQ